MLRARVVPGGAEKKEKKKNLDSMEYFKVVGGWRTFILQNEDRSKKDDDIQ